MKKNWFVIVYNGLYKIDKMSLNEKEVKTQLLKCKFESELENTNDI